MTQVSVQTYLFFDGNTEQALDYYQSTLGAEVEFMMRFNQSPEPVPGLPEGHEDRIMHATFRIGDTALMASDGLGPDSGREGFSLSINTDSEQQARSWFDALAEDGEVIMPLEKTFWAPLFGMIKDSFGVSWMINVDDSQSA